jgi:hypothetical protein
MCRIAYFPATHRFTREELGGIFETLENAQGGTGSGLFTFDGEKWTNGYLVDGKNAKMLAEDIPLDQAILFHARMASSGDRCKENLQPFLSDNLLLAHNGHIGALDESSFWQKYFRLSFRPSDSYVLYCLLSGKHLGSEAYPIIEEISTGHALFMARSDDDTMHVYHSKSIYVYGDLQYPRMVCSQTLPAFQKESWHQILRHDRRWQETYFTPSGAIYDCEPRIETLYSAYQYGKHDMDTDQQSSLFQGHRYNQWEEKKIHHPPLLQIPTLDSGKNGTTNMSGDSSTTIIDDSEPILPDDLVTGMIFCVDHEVYVTRVMKHLYTKCELYTKLNGKIARIKDIVEEGDGIMRPREFLVEFSDGTLLTMDEQGYGGYVGE